MDLKYWKQFENSGKIEDYLNFVSSTRQETEREKTAKEIGHAGVYMGDGDHTEADTGGRVRQAYQSFN